MRIDTKSDTIGFADIVLKLDGEEYYAKSISYGDSMEPGDVRGNSSMALGTTRGEYQTDTGDLELFAENFYALVEKHGNLFYVKKIPIITVTYNFLDENGNPRDPKNDELVGCKLTKRPANHSGADALTYTVGVKPMFVRWDGKDPLPPHLMPKGMGGGGGGQATPL